MQLTMVYEVRFRINGGRILCKHFEAPNPKRAAQKIRGKKAKVISVKKVRPTDVIGLIEQIQLPPNKPLVTGNVMLDEITLDEIVFGRKSNRRFENASKKGKYRRE